jgi:hypothetical protein
MVSKTSGRYGISQSDSERHRRAADGKMKLVLRNITKLLRIIFYVTLRPRSETDYSATLTQ